MTTLIVRPSRKERHYSNDRCTTTYKVLSVISIIYRVKRFDQVQLEFEQRDMSDVNGITDIRDKS